MFIDSFDLNHHVIVLTETWLSDKVLSTEILSNSYNIFRLDRKTDTIGGGVLIAVSNIFPTEVINVVRSDNIEFIAVKIKLKSKQVYITCSYIPPKSDKVIFSLHLESIKSVVISTNPEDAIFVFGDFNLPTISWTFLSDNFYYVPIKVNDWIDEFLINLSELCLFQINGICNDTGKLLDLIFVNEPADCALERTFPITKPEDRYHPTIEVSCNLPMLSQCKRIENNGKKKYFFQRANFDDLNFLLCNTNWLELLAVSDGTPVAIDKMVNTFYTTIFDYIDECVPKYAERKHSGPPWSSKELSRLKNLKNKRYKNYKKSGSLIDYGIYSVKRAEYNLLNIKLYNDYLNKIKVNFKRDPKTFYSFVNSKRKAVGYPTVLKYLSYESSNDLAISNMFADFFATTYSDSHYDDTNDYPFEMVEQQPISFSIINTSHIVNCIKTQKSSFYHGPDGVPSCILKNCATAFSTPLSIIFNTSIKYGYFPKYWRDSYIIPLFKSGNKSAINNYRGIAKLSAIPKLFEKCLMDSLSHKTQSLLSPLQHGFRKGCSTTTNLLHLTTLIIRGFTIGQHTDVIYTDFSKAFDKVNHKLLLKKLYLMGFTKNCVNWIKSYLTDRNQRVLFNNAVSKKVDVISGVPQGSHLGPLLFSLFVNDLPSIIKFSHVLMYADDIKIFQSFDNYIDYIHLQQDLDSFFIWCTKNLMELNLKKCQHMRFSRKHCVPVNYSLGGYQLESVDKILDLGVLLDPKLNFIQHITLTVNKARGVLFYIKRWAKEFSDPIITKQLYISLVRPILEYCSIIWNPQYNVRIQMIESVQKQFLLFCLRSLYSGPAVDLPSYTSRLALIKLPTLKSRRKMLNVSFLHKLINGEICSEFLLSKVTFNVPQRPTRYFNPLYVPFFRQNYVDADPFIRMSNDFNDLYNVIDFSVNVNIIKRNIILYLNN